MARVLTGYLVAITNPNFSGIATAHLVRTRKDLRAKRFTSETVRRVLVEAGFGVRQIMRAHGVGPIEVGPDMPRSRFTVDDLGMMATYEVEG